MTANVKLALTVLGFLVCLILLGILADAPEPQPQKQPQTTERAAPKETEDTKLQTPPEVKEYSISVNPKVVAGTQVAAEISTNIPGSIEVMASLSLAGQSPEDTFIGATQRVTLADGTGQVNFDASKLPHGSYNFKASFYPRWGFKGEQARATGIQDSIEASSRVELTGSGESSENVVLRENGQKWVMENIHAGVPWDSALWREKFGDHQEITIDRYNPRVIKAYYFDSIDTTVFINVLKNEVTVWRLGKARH